jgi:hypothetical protein
MAAGITARQYTNNAVFTEKTTTMQLDEHVLAGPNAPRNLIDEAVIAMGGSLPSGILLSNTSGTTIIVRVGYEAQGGLGIQISSLGSMFFPITGVPTTNGGGIWVEIAAAGATACFAICFE